MASQFIQYIAGYIYQTKKTFKFLFKNYVAIKTYVEIIFKNVVYSNQYIEICVFLYNTLECY